MANSTRTFIIHSLKLQPEAETLESQLQSNCYIPGRDTPQTTGEEILQANYEAMRDSADTVYVIWDGQSMGTLFDMGMAYAMGKTIIPSELAHKRSWVDYFQANLNGEIKHK